MTHAHDDTCTLSTYEGEGESRRLVVYRGRRAVIDWLNRVADLARERSGEAASVGSSAASPVRAHQPHQSHLRGKSAGSGRTTPRDDPPAPSV